MNPDYSPDRTFKSCVFCGNMGILEQACNQIICSCNGEWCFIRAERYVSMEAHQDSQRYGDPEYDSECYDDKGFHRDSRFDRESYTRAGYNSRGLNRQEERMKGFATRILGDGEGGDIAAGQERRWGREVRRELDASGVDGLGRLVENYFNAFESGPDTFEQFHSFVSAWLGDDGKRIGVNAVADGTGVPNL